MALAETKVKSVEEQKWEKVLDILDEHAKERRTVETVRYGEAFMVPEMYRGKLVDAGQRLINIGEEEQKPTRFTKVFPYRKWDCLVALVNVFWNRFGIKVTQKLSFFEAPQYKSIPISPTDWMQVPYGAITIQVFKGTLRVYSVGDFDEDSEEYMEYEDKDSCVMMMDTAQGNENRVNSLWDMIEKEVRENSIYRGQAVEASRDMPKFMNLSKFDPDTVIYNSKEYTQLDANLWLPIRRPEILKERGLKTGRKVCLGGAYGTGKTLTGKLTAKLCAEVGRTFILCNPKSNDVFDCLRMAVQYSEPDGSCLFVEDIDRLTDMSDKNAIARVLDELDGFQSKGFDVMMVFTTNRPHDIHQGVLRPGRLDSVIMLEEHDTEATKKMFKLKFGESFLEDVDVEAVHKEMDGFTPAFTLEVCEKARLYAGLSVEKGGEERYSTDAILAVVDEVRNQYNLHKKAPDVKLQGTLDKGVRTIMEDVLEDAEIIRRGTAWKADIEVERQ